jgi:hypothetical protein
MNSHILKSSILFVCVHATIDTLTGGTEVEDLQTMQLKDEVLNEYYTKDEAALAPKFFVAETNDHSKI